MRSVLFSRNTTDLSDRIKIESDGGWFGRRHDRDGFCRGRVGPGPVTVLGPFDRPLGHLAFDNAGVGSQASFGQEAAQNLSQTAPHRPGELTGGKTPPGRLPDGVRG